jgi:micrococcal nuclease
MATWLAKLGDSHELRVHTIWTIVAVTLFAAGMLLGVKMARPTYEVSSEEEDFPLAICKRVLDGDTIEVIWMGNDERVRMLGIDAPETRRTRSLRAQAEQLSMDPEFLLRYGEIATRTVENWLFDRKVRLVFPEGRILRDNFGRLLCYVELQGTDIGERLLLGGNAITYEAPHPREEAYKLFQAEAQKQRRGIWRNL